MKEECKMRKTKEGTLKEEDNEERKEKEKRE